MARTSTVRLALTRLCLAHESLCATCAVYKWYDGNCGVLCTCMSKQYESFETDRNIGDIAIPSLPLGKPHIHFVTRVSIT